MLRLQLVARAASRSDPWRDDVAPALSCRGAGRSTTLGLAAWPVERLNPVAAKRTCPMTVALTLNLDEPAIDALDRLAQSTGSSRDWLVSRALEAYANLEAWQTDKILRGLAAANEGRFAADDEVARVRAKYAPPA